ncbi:hypothetical protein MPSEU_000893400 [Mayamaea pseudoterrestris]|nr:hypothetical protein MPSEU_000893400 [Mayamaea pseudoterrestris]
MMDKRLLRIATAKIEMQQWQILVILFFVSSSFAFTSSSKSERTAAFDTTSMIFTQIPRQRVTFTNKRPFDFRKQRERLRRTRYQRKRIPETEKELQFLQQERQAEFERIMEKADARGESPIWSFESLFPGPVIDTESVHRDLYAAKERDIEINAKRSNVLVSGESSLTWKNPSLERKSTAFRLPLIAQKLSLVSEMRSSPPPLKKVQAKVPEKVAASRLAASSSIDLNITALTTNSTYRIDRGLTRLVEDQIYGMRRTSEGTFDTTTYMVTDGAVQFRDGIRVGNPLKINADRLNYLAKKDFRHGRIEEAQELYEQAMQLDPRDGRAYLGLSRCAQRRRDFKLARSYLKAGIARAFTPSSKDRGANPFLLQALGCLEERMGNLGQAEALYIATVRSRPSHAAGWVSLAQLRTRKLGQGVNAGRVCYQEAEHELMKAGLPPSAYVYTAWATLECNKAGDARKARELFKSALKADPTCSAALLQLGVMESSAENWKDAEECFEKVLKFDQRNSRVLQAYAIMETKRPGGKSRKAIDLFERALDANPRDAGVLQAYALYVAELGDMDAARKLLRRGTKVNKRHSPVWQAWGVLETKHGLAEDARRVFQQGIWACAQLNGDNSGGYHCARLWQAWGILEAREEDYAAARRCFSRALDADSRNVPAITAWASMEADLGNIRDARSIFERALPKFAPGSDDKISLWRNYELMEQRQANVDAAQQVYQRAIGEAITVSNDLIPKRGLRPEDEVVVDPVKTFSPQEVEVVRWEGGGGVWLNNRAIETKLPFKLRNRKSR